MNGVFRKAMFILPLLLFFVASKQRAVAGDYQPPAPTRTVAVLRETWHDANRHRDIPVKIYYPRDAEGVCPIILLSHGLGGTCEGYEYLGRYWAGNGFVSVHLQHAGSDDAVWKGRPLEQIPQSMAKVAANPVNALNRTKDVRFAIDRLAELARSEGTAFWDAYLRGNRAAKDWLYGGGFKRALGESGTFETKSRQARTILLQTHRVRVTHDLPERVSLRA